MRPYLPLLWCLGACADRDKPATESAPPSGEVGVTLRRTAYGVVHVTADDLYGVGYGVGYAYTEDNACLLAWRVAEVTGRLSAQIGAEADVALPVHGVSYPALESDRFYRGWLDDAEIDAGFASGSEDVRALAEGYAAGVARYLDLYGMPGDCDVQFVEPLSVAQVYRMWVATALVASGEVLAPYLATQAPSAARRPAVRPTLAPAEGALLRPRPPFGSNAIAIGREGTQDGGGVHLYNPHFPWSGIHRVYLVHLTIPGELDVMGAALGGLPLPAAGFNMKLAWGLTFSTAARFTVAELPLVEGDPFHYTVDGATRAITEEILSIDVAGESMPREVSFYRAEDGPVLHAPAYTLGWSTSTAFAVHDVNQNNTRMVEQLLGLARAQSVGDARVSLSEVLGIPWSYTTAVDDAGDVLFAELSNAPNVSSALLASCNTSETAEALRPYGILVLDGSRGDCAWTGALAADALPWVKRADYVANSNNTYDLPNVAAPLVGYSEVLGATGAPLGLRPTLGLRMIEDRISGADGLGEPGFTAALAEQIFHQERGLAGELLAPALAADCLADPTGSWRGTEVDLGAVCAALADWDGRYEVDARGALIFDGLWAAMEDGSDPEDLFATPADWADPLGTPAGYTEDSAVRADAREALARVALTLAEAGLSADTSWGEAHAVDGPAGRLGVPGGAGRQGVYDVLESDEGYGTFRGWTTGLDGTAPEHLFGASYEHVVSLGPDGPTASGLLSYSQATEPGSPYYLDQLDGLSAGAWFSFPFREEAILADPALVETAL